MTHYLELKYSISRSRETHGWNICSLWDSINQKKLASTCGGGYDMRGHVLGQWIEKNFSQDLLGLDTSVFYGSFRTEKGVRLDGCCGWDCMVKILKHIGYSLRTTTRDRKGNMIGFVVSKVES